VKGLEELRRSIADSTERKRIADCFALSTFYRHGVRANGYEPPATLVDAIVLSESGSNLLGRLDPEIGESVGKFVVFLTFAYDDVFVDFQKTDIRAVKASLSEDIVKGSIKFPWVYEHLLYDLAVDWAEERPNSLTTEQTEILLSASPKGVFQMSTYVTGPFGVLESVQSRAISPYRGLLLWHCADPMCSTPHRGMLQQLNGSVDEACRELRVQLQRKGSPSDWSLFCSRIMTDDHWYQDYSLVNLPGLLGNGFSVEEIRKITTVTLDGSSGVQRSAIQPLGLRGPAAQITRDLQKPELLQILLLADDQTIVAAAEDLITKRSLYIPPLETRYARDFFGVRSYFDPLCQCSELGIRVFSNNRIASPSARLKHLILSIFSGGSNPGLLAFRLRKISGNTMGQKLEKYLSSHEPYQALSELVLLTPELMRAACEHVGASHLRGLGLEDDEQLIRRLLWKLGFQRDRYDSILEPFYKRLKLFRKLAIEGDFSSEDGIAEIRSGGVNVFVRLEEVLDLALVFSTWVLLTDHVSEQHTFCLAKARSLVCTHLSGVITTADGPVEYDAAGKNTLFPLVSGFLALRKRTEEALASMGKYERPPVQLAHFAHSSGVQKYPYRHIYFALDAVESELRACLELLPTPALRSNQGQ
jgi:hypothetical protein